MKNRCFFAALALLLLLLTACGQTKDNEQTMHLFFPRQNPEAGGDIIDSIAVDWSPYSDQDAWQQICRMVTLLQNADKKYPFTSPIPAEAELLRCTVSGGLAVLDFSAPFRRLSGMKLTVADSCLTLTVSQILGVHWVQILVEGSVPEGWRDTFTTDDVLLTSREDVAKVITVTLYFPDEDGNLQSRQQELQVYEGENRCLRVVEALQDGPGTEGLLPLFPEGVQLPIVWLENDVCCVSFSQADFRTLSDAQIDQEMLLDGLVHSLCDIDGVEQVRILADGAYRSKLGAADISRPLTPN